MHAEDVFRSVNDRIAEKGWQLGWRFPGPFLCECSDMHCFARLELTLEAYEELRSNPQRYLTVPGHEVAVRDRNGRVLGEREIGRIYFRGPSMMTGYFEHDDATRAAFTDDGFMDTGDMGYCHPEGFPQFPHEVGSDYRTGPKGRTGACASPRAAGRVRLRRAPRRLRALPRRTANADPPPRRAERGGGLGPRSKPLFANKSRRLTLPPDPIGKPSRASCGNAEYDTVSGGDSIQDPYPDR